MSKVNNKPFKIIPKIPYKIVETVNSVLKKRKKVKESKTQI